MKTLLAKSFKGPSSGSSTSTSVSYDYSELDRQDKLRDAAQALDAKKASLLYSGDIGGMLALNKQKRGLLSELAKPAGVRVKSSSAKNSSDGSGPQVSQEVRHEPNQQTLPKQNPVPKPPKPKKGAGDLLFDNQGTSAVGNNNFENYA